MTPAAATPDGLLTPPELRLCEAGASVGSDWLFRGMDLLLQPGDWSVIMGPSGAGKTTLLRLLAGLLAPGEGEARIAGRPWSQIRGVERVALRRRFGYVQQQPGLLHATVKQNVLAPLRWREMPREQASERALQSLSEVGMEHLASQSALALSGGERQRLAFARALALRPEIWLLDEFTNHQDPRREDVLESIVGGQIRRGATAIIIAHELGQVERLRASAGSNPSLVVLVDGRWRATDLDHVVDVAKEQDAVTPYLRRLAERHAAVHDRPSKQE